jgi:hypothetical protein
VRVIVYLLISLSLSSNGSIGHIINQLPVLSERIDLWITPLMKLYMLLYISLFFFFLFSCLDELGRLPVPIYT